MLLSRCVCPDFLTQYSLFTFSMDFLYLFYLLASFYWPLETGYRDIDITIGPLYRGGTIHLQTWWFPFWVKVSRTQREPLAACKGVGKCHQNFGISPATLLSPVVHIFVSEFLCFKSGTIEVCTRCIIGAMYQILQAVWGIDWHTSLEYAHGSENIGAHTDMQISRCYLL